MDLNVIICLGIIFVQFSSLECRMGPVALGRNHLFHRPRPFLDCQVPMRRFFDMKKIRTGSNLVFLPPLFGLP